MPRFQRRQRSKRFGIYRSGLEKEVAEQLLAAGVKSSYEGVKLKYLRPASSHSYTPDFPLDIRLGKRRIVIEAKGYFDSDDRKKHLWLKESCPDVDVWFVFTKSDKPIRKGSKTTYADWCRKHGFKFCDKIIPDVWFYQFSKGVREREGEK